MKNKELKKKNVDKGTMSICSFIFLVWVFTFAACSSDDDEKPVYTDDSPYAKLAEGLYRINGGSYTAIQLEGNSPGNDTFVTDAFAWVNAGSSGTSDVRGEYVLVLDGKVYNTAGSVNELTKEYTTLIVYGKQHAVIQLTGEGRMFDIGSLDDGLDVEGIWFVLDGNLTLKGIDENHAALLDVSFGATVEMKGNTRITNNSKIHMAGAVTRLGLTRQTRSCY